ncbi:MAG: hypothetical protein ACOCZ6_00565 [Nanoarchaeota archaeon]
MNTKRAQVSLEFLLVTALIMMIMMGSLSFLLFFAQSSTDRFVQDRVQDIGKTMVKNAELLTVYGPPAKRVVDFNFPPRVLNMTIEDDHYLFIKVQMISGPTQHYMFYSSYNMSGEFEERDFSEGRHSFLLEANETEVKVKRWA